MTAQHTPGPWIFSTEPLSYCDRHVRSILANNGSLMDDEQYYPSVPHNEADWHLIAAAPELLQALQAMLDNSGNREMARTAIAKATGATK